MILKTLPLAALACLLAAMVMAPDTALAEPVPPKEGELVVVERSAWLYAAPRKKAKRWRDPKRKIESADPYFTFELLELKKKWARVRAPLDVTIDRGWLSGDRRICYESTWGIASYGVELWVERDELLPVSREEIDIRHNDETRVRLAPGVVHQPKKDGEYLALADGFEVTLKPGDDVIGYSYEPGSMSGGADNKQGRERLKLSSSEVTLGGEPLKVGLSYVYKSEKAQNGMLVELRGSCGIYLVLARPESAEEDVIAPPRDNALFGVIGGASPSGEVQVVEPGTTVYWKNGDRAGEIQRKVTLNDPQERDDLLCVMPTLFEPSLGDGTTIEVCLKKGTIKTEKRESLSDMFESTEGLDGENPFEDINP